MATFHIHEDKENFKQKTLQSLKQAYSGFHVNKICNKKYVELEKRGTFQSVSNGTRHNAKRPRFTDKDEDVKLKIELEKRKTDDSFLEDSFCKIDNDNEAPCGGEKEADEFPMNLYLNKEYRKDIWKYLTQVESEGPHPKPNYMLKQTDLSWHTRSILVDWLGSVADEYKFCDLTFHLSVNYIDRFLSQISVTRGKFQLLGAAAMMLAEKMEEYQSLDANEWSYLTGDTFSPRQVLKMEQLILRVLKFKMQPPTTYDFIQHLSAEYKMEAKIIHLAMYISELVLLEGEDYLEYFPSQLAAASIAFARHMLSKQKPWPKKLKKVSGYTLKELSPVMQRQQKTFRESPLKEQQAIQSKYKSEKYNKVALLKPKVLNLDGFVDEE